ncbi:MAG: glycosyltransferase family 2 protein [Kiritimatiellia bacterium]|jgi:glycosyltransferase involved in cell wall biosynthesis
METTEAGKIQANDGPPEDVIEAARLCLGADGLLSVVMPAFNLGPAIHQNIHHVHNVFAGRIPFEIVPVDDGSADDTAAEIRRAAEDLPDAVFPVYAFDNSGKGAALASGFNRSSGSHVLLLDADLDLNPDFIWRFFEIMRDEDADVVIGSKMHPESIIQYPLKRRIASRVYYGLVKLLIGLPVHDTQTGMKLFRREALAYAFSRMLAKRFAFDLEVLSIARDADYRIAEAPVELDFGDNAGSLTLTNVKQVMTDTLAIFYRLRVLRYYESITPCDPPALTPGVSAVIACPGPSAVLDRCIEALRRQNWPSLEIVVLPDEPTGRDWGPGVREIPTGKVRPAEKRNLGIQEAIGELIAFVDDDAAPLADWLRYAIPYFTDESIAAVGGPAITPPSDPFLSKMGGRVYENIFVSGGRRRRYTPTRVCDEDDLPSCNLIVRADALRELGGFNTRYWPGEDTILCQDIVHTLGKRIVYDPRVVVTHHRRPLFGPHLRQVGRYARHRGFFARRFPATSRRLVYMLPSLFVLGGAVGLPLAFLHPVLRMLYLGVLAIYAILTFLSSVSLRRPHVWLVTWAGVVATHFTYGIGFLRGLFARDMAREVRPFDHVSDTAATP